MGPKHNDLEGLVILLSESLEEVSDRMSKLSAFELRVSEIVGEIIEKAQAQEDVFVKMAYMESAELLIEAAKKLHEERDDNGQADG